jgi:hypothetical protein
MVAILSVTPGLDAIGANLGLHLIFVIPRLDLGISFQEI